MNGQRAQAMPRLRIKFLSFCRASAAAGPAAAAINAVTSANTAASVPEILRIIFAKTSRSCLIAPMLPL
jgi:hypothetical protein